MSGPEGGASATPSVPAKPRLKLNVSRSASFATDASPSIATPGGADGAGRKVKLKIGGSVPATPATPAAAEATPVKTKAGRQSKPSQKLVESRKRSREEDDDDDDMPLSSSHPATKIKIRPGLKPSHTQLVLKPRGRPPVHPPGDGYDSEASDRELDPAIEEQLVLRMAPGEHCDYLRWCIENGKMGLSKNSGGADVSLKFFDEDTHRAAVTIKGTVYAAVMLDLPTITEAMKTWDRKSFLKSADICQMLYVFQKVRNEEEARRAALPTMIDTGFKWPHGLTPPMHDCVNRRFAKTISRKEIENKENEVERLLSEDGMAESTSWEWVDERQLDDRDDDEDGTMDEDAEGELDDTMGGTFYGDEDAEGDDDLQAAMEAAFEAVETPATATEGTTPFITQANTPAVHQSIEVGEESEESEEDDDDDDDDDDDLDEDERAEKDEIQGVKEIVNQLKRQLAQRKLDLEKTQNHILRKRVESQIKQLKSEIELKLNSIGLETDD